MKKRVSPSLPRQSVTAGVTALSHDGRGIAHIAGKTTFIRGALPSERVRFTYLNRRSRFDEGQLETLEHASPDRVVPRCSYFSVCGGCNLQHLDSSAQLRLKESMLLEQLAHFGKVIPQSVLDPLIASPWVYRRKARLGVRYQVVKKKMTIGFRDVTGAALVDIQHCDVLATRLNTCLGPLHEQMRLLDEFALISHIEMAMGDERAALVFRHVRPLTEHTQNVLIQFGQTHQIDIYLQPGEAKSAHCIWPSSETHLLAYTLPEQNIKLFFHPTDFIQVNADLNQRLVTRTLELLAPEKTDHILDLFCGLGNFTLPLARYCREVSGVEGDIEMVNRARDNARYNKIQNVTFHCSNLAEEVQSSSWRRMHYDKILLDPPRTGAYELVKNLPKRNVNRIVYVSCNPATLARDAGELVRQGYTFVSVGIIDMFSHTRHIESIAVFSL